MRVRLFGGLYPKASARAIPADGAQTNNNLLSNTTEFRPLADDTTVVAASGVTGPLTIFRLQRNADGSLNTNFASASNWRVTAADINYVKGQINSDTTDRHYYSFNDGSAAPRWTDKDGTDRQLGVPAPTAAPAIVVNATETYTAEVRHADLEGARVDTLNIIAAAVTSVWRGGAHPGTTTTGYVDRDVAYGFSPAYSVEQVRLYRLTGVGGTISDAYATPADDTFSWIFDPLLPSFTFTATSGTPTWAGGAGTVHLAIPFAGYGQTADLDTGAITTQLGALTMPGTSDGTKLFNGGQVAEIVADLSAAVAPTGSAIKPKIDALAAAVANLKGLLDGGNYTSLAGTTQAFYSKTDVAAEITQMIANAAEAIYATAYNVAHSSLPEDYTGAGAAGPGSGY